VATAQKSGGSTTRKGGSPAETRPDSKAKTKKVEKKSPTGEHSPAVERSAPAPIEEVRIRERAHRIWNEEGRPEGRDVEHWERARKEIEREAR
jgi:Protein of unknown function (DUF2934)